MVRTAFGHIMNMFNPIFHKLFGQPRTRPSIRRYKRAHGTLILATSKQEGGGGKLGVQTSTRATQTRPYISAKIGPSLKFSGVHIG